MKKYLIHAYKKAYGCTHSFSVEVKATNPVAAKQMFFSNHMARIDSIEEIA